LSIAQKRVVMIARALLARARLVVLDEPTTSLTDEEIKHLHAICRRMKEHGGSILYVSHRLDEILSLTDRVTVMRDGEVELAAPTRGPTRRCSSAGSPSTRARRTGRSRPASCCSRRTAATREWCSTSACART